MAENRENDLILAPNEYAFISDTQSGNISVIVGPNKKSLAGTDQLMTFSTDSKVFERCQMKQAIQIFPFADNRSYIELLNPAREEATAHPKPEKSNLRVDLAFGDKININGPCTFALWPGQVARVIQGHQLRYNQYLLVQVYNEKGARENWREAVVKSADGAASPNLQKESIPDLVTGKLLVIKGTEVSFYIPPTGIQVLPDTNGNYVRDAVTIERLQYCILLDESGDKRYVRGPAVVFPKPTETFITRHGKRIFNAIELNENMGLYIKVIADYRDEDWKKDFKAGEEIFITGKEQKIYYPRSEHALIKYGEDPVHYAVAIPNGEARYVLDKKTGAVAMVRGPQMYLPNPVDNILVRRILDEKHVKLWFPGNEEALKYNRDLKQLNRDNPDKFVLDSKLAPKAPLPKPIDPELAEKGADELTRKTTFTPPRTLTLDTKYEGAVNINVWPGYAVQLVSNTGERQVVVGPKSVLLDYDQILDAMELSTGTPKTDQTLIRTAYLRIKNNRISDVVDAVTRDLVNIKIRLNYRVNFEGDSKRWFEVENYVHFLCDHCRSMIRNAVKGYGIEEFNDHHIKIIRDVILHDSKEGKREGRLFPENGMRIYEVEVLNIVIGDADIAQLVREAQHGAVSLAIKVAREEKELSATQRIEQYRQSARQAKSATIQKDLELQLQEEKTKTELPGLKLKTQIGWQEDKNLISRNRLNRKKALADMELGIKQTGLEMETKSYRDKMESIQPKLLEALIAAGEMELARALAENLPKSSGPLAGLFGNGGIDGLLQMVKGTRFEKGVEQILKSDGKKP